MDILARELELQDRAVRSRPLRAPFAVPVSFTDGESLGTSHVLVPGRKHKGKQVRTAVLFSGGPAAGGHNVVLGIAKIVKDLVGVRGGPGGLLKGRFFKLKDLGEFANMGGFDLLGTDRTKIKPDQIDAVRHTLSEHDIGAVIVIGGDDSNTNAALLAERIPEVQFIGVPKTMDGDLAFGHYLPTPFGFDTATKVYAELVGNICRDAVSSGKYWHFIRLMGRSASHVTLEVALRTRPAVALISEEIERTGQPLHDIVSGIARTIQARAAHGLHHGVVLVPEGLLEHIPEIKSLIADIGAAMQKHERKVKPMDVARRAAFLARKLQRGHRKLFLSFPEEMREMLTLDRDAHGNLNVSQIPTEQLLVRLVQQHVPSLKANTHFFGYEGRCGVPSQFDAHLGYALGLVAGSLVLDGRTGYMAAVSALDKGGRPLALPLKALLAPEERAGSVSLVIAKSRVRLDDHAFQYFLRHRMEWAQRDPAAYPAPRQLTGPDTMPFTVTLNQGYKGPRL